VTAAPDLAVPASRGALYYVIGAFTAPHSRVRELMAELRLKSLAWQIVLFCAAISAASGIASNYFDHKYRGGVSYILPPDYPVADTLIWGAIEFLIFIAGFPVARFLWSYLFGYRDEERGVWAASAMAMCPLIILDPLLEIISFFTGSDEETSLYLLVFVAYAFVSAAITALYYTAALAISYLRAAALAFASMLIYLLAAIVLTTVIILLPSFLFPPV